MIRTIFEMEDRSWKGRAGSSVLKNPSMLDLFLREAVQVESCGALDVWLLMADGVPIAFEYCHSFGKTTVSHKISYDEAYSKYAPGKMLRYFQLRELMQDDRITTLDTSGFYDPSKSKWCNQTYESANVFLALSNYMNAAVYLAELARKVLRAKRSLLSSSTADTSS